MVMVDVKLKAFFTPFAVSLRSFGAGSLVTLSSGLPPIVFLVANVAVKHIKSTIFVEWLYCVLIELTRAT